MKTIKSITLVFLLFFLFTACDEECISGSGSTVTAELSLPPFNSVALLGSERLIIDYGPEQRVLVEGQQNIINRINRDVRGGHWDAFMEGCVRNSRSVTYYVTLPELEQVGLSGSGDVNVGTGFEGEEMTVLLSGSGSIETNANTDYFVANITGSGRVKVNGFAEDSEVVISGSGLFDGFGLETDYTRVNITGSGDARVTVNEKLRAIISGSGNVYYRGNPSVDSDITGSGSVKQD